MLVLGFKRIPISPFLENTVRCTLATTDLSNDSPKGVTVQTVRYVIPLFSLINLDPKQDPGASIISFLCYFTIACKELLKRLCIYVHFNILKRSITAYGVVEMNKLFKDVILLHVCKVLDFLRESCKFGLITKMANK